MNGQFYYALLLSTLAGLSTTIGSVIGIFFSRPGPKYMSFTLGFSAGVLVLVSFVDLLAQATKSLGLFPSHLVFFGGIAIIFLLDLILPHSYIAETHKVKDQAKGYLLKVALLNLLGIAIHNFPEGIATFAVTLKDMRLGMSLAIAIAIHNIPEGIAVSAPIFAATGSKKKAFFWSFFSGVCEPLGAIIAAIFLLPYLNVALLNYILAGVAGIMVFISLDELMPASRLFKEEHLATLGIIVGMIVMSLSLVLLLN